MNLRFEDPSKDESGNKKLHESWHHYRYSLRVALLSLRRSGLKAEGEVLVYSNA